MAEYVVWGESGRWLCGAVAETRVLFLDLHRPDILSRGHVQVLLVMEGTATTMEPQRLTRMTTRTTTTCTSSPPDEGLCLFGGAGGDESLCGHIFIPVINIIN